MAKFAPGHVTKRTAKRRSSSKKIKGETKNKMKAQVLI